MITFVSISGLNLVQANQSSNNNNNNNNITCNNANASSNCNTIPLPYMVREQDQYMPITNMIRIMRHILPPHAKISDDSKETIQECVSEFISFITGEANERCQHEQRKTVNAEDVIWAMGKLGFDEYVEPLTLFLGRYRESENDKTLLGEPNSKRSLDFGSLSMGPPPLPIAPLPMGPPFHMGHQQRIFDSTAMTLMSGYYKDGSDDAAGSSSEVAMTEYDLFAPFN